MEMDVQKYIVIKIQTNKSMKIYLYPQIYFFVYFKFIVYFMRFLIPETNDYNIIQFFIFRKINLHVKSDYVCNIF